MKDQVVVPFENPTDAKTAFYMSKYKKIIEDNLDKSPCRQAFDRSIVRSNSTKKRKNK